MTTIRGVRLLAASALIAGIVAPAGGADRAVQLSADPHWNAYTPAAPVFLGTLQSPEAPIDPASFVLEVDGRAVYVSGADWFLYPGSTFDLRFEGAGGRTVTWEYRQGCAHRDGLAEGRHEIRFTFRDAEGRTFGEDATLAFFVDRTPPSVRFEGLDLIVRDEGSGPYLDPRVESRHATSCGPGRDRLCLALAGAAPGWQIDCEPDPLPGLKVDAWLVSTGPRGTERRLAGTESVGWSVSTVRSADGVRARLEPPANRRRVDPDALLEFVAYSRRLAMFGADEEVAPPAEVVELLEAEEIPFAFDRERRQLTVYLAGPVDRALNAHPPVFSPLLSPVTGEPAARPVQGAGGPGEPGAAGGVQGAAQGTVLEIERALIYPNPVDPRREDATIEYDLSGPADVEIVAYDWNGEFVDTVYRGAGTGGTNTARWGGQSEDGRKLGNGTYLIRITASTAARREAKVLKAVVWNDD